jgi:hypothetical protein
MSGVGRHLPLTAGFKAGLDPPYSLSNTLKMVGGVPASCLVTPFHPTRSVIKAESKMFVSRTTKITTL